MIPGLNPKKMAAVMKQLGMSQEEIDASQVIIKKSENSGKIIIDNPSVVKVKMSGQETFQISGNIREESAEIRESEDFEEANESEESDKEFEQDIETIMEKTGADKEEAVLALEKNNGDIAKAILELSK